MKIKISLIILTVFVILISGLIFYYFSSPNRQITRSADLIEPQVTQELELTKYTNKKFGFSFAYPEKWGLPKEKEVLPAQEKVFSISFQNIPYTLDLFNQLLPVSALSFLRNYFGEKLIWAGESQSPTGIIFAFSDDQSISGQQAGFVSPKGKYVLLIIKDAQLDSTSVTKDGTLVSLFTSVNWFEN